MEGMEEAGKGEGSGESPGLMLFAHIFEGNTTLRVEIE